MRHYVLVALASLLGLAGACQKSALAPAAGSPPAAASGRPQPKLPTIKLWLGAHELITELAVSDEEQSRGMMWRTNMAEMEGMLFIFAEPKRAAFWMRNTLVPLDGAYVSPEGVILEIHPMHPLEERSIEAASDRIQYVLETRQGWFQRNNVAVGMQIRTEKGSLQETFSRRR